MNGGKQWVERLSKVESLWSVVGWWIAALHDNHITITKADESTHTPNLTNKHPMEKKHASYGCLKQQQGCLQTPSPLTRHGREVCRGWHLSDAPPHQVFAAPQQASGTCRLALLFLSIFLHLLLFFRLQIDPSFLLLHLITFFRLFFSSLPSQSSQSLPILAPPPLPVKLLPCRSILLSHLPELH